MLIRVTAQPRPKQSTPHSDMTRNQPHIISQQHAQRPLGPTAASLNLLTVALWGGTPVAISYSVDTLPPVAVAGLRFAMASVFMLFWCRISGAGFRLQPGQFGPSFVLGVLLFFQITTFTVGVALSNSSHGTVLINTFVFWVAGIEHFVTRTHRLNRSRTLGLLLAAGGALLILLVGPESPAEFPLTDTPLAEQSHAATGHHDSPSLLGDMILLVSGLLLGIKIIYTKQAVKTVEPGKLIFWHDVIGLAFFATYSLAFETIHVDDFQRSAVLGLLYQGIVVAGFCFAMQAHLLKHHAASQLAVFSFLTPLFGVTVAVLFRGDALSPWLLVSGFCVAAGILIVNAPASAKSARDQQ